MSYTVKEIFYSLQGEGHHSGRPAVFCRFSGCNLWSGREEDRARAQCTFCDTDFVGVGPDGGKFADAQALARRIAGHWPAQGGGTPYVVCTGGKPLLQLDALLIDALHAQGFEVAVETNGTLPAPRGLDWICVSPKGKARLAQTWGHELKLVYPQADGSVCAMKATAEGPKRMDCASGFGAATMVTATFGFVAVSHALKKMMAKAARQA